MGSDGSYSAESFETIGKNHLRHFQAAGEIEIDKIGQMAFSHGGTFRHSKLL